MTKTSVSLTYWRRKLRRLAVKEQDGMCIYCGVSFDESNPATLEHIIPLSKGGPDQHWNIAASCDTCNNLRGSANHKAFLAYMQKRRERDAEENSDVCDDPYRSGGGSM